MAILNIDFSREDARIDAIEAQIANLRKKAEAIVVRVQTTEMSSQELGDCLDAFRDCERTVFECRNEISEIIKGKSRRLDLAVSQANA